jgi:hypothetical protein
MERNAAQAAREAALAQRNVAQAAREVAQASETQLRACVASSCPAGSSGVRVTSCIAAYICNQHHALITRLQQAR